jgi:hypothetical protein
VASGGWPSPLGRMFQNACRVRCWERDKIVRSRPSFHASPIWMAAYSNLQPGAAPHVTAHSVGRKCRKAHCIGGKCHRAHCIGR